MLQALLAPISTLETVRQNNPELTVVPLRQGIGIIPIPIGLNQAKGSQEFPFDPGKTFRFLDDWIVQILKTTSYVGLIAYIEVDLFGGQGHQAAVLWKDGKITLGPLWDEKSPLRRRPINRVLKRMGVKLEEHIDQFDAVGLGTHRFTDDWLK